MVEQRKNTRYKTSATVIIQGAGKEKALLKDISITGCRVELAGGGALDLHKLYKMKVIPEDAAEIDSFFLTVECKRAGTEADSSGFGFTIVKSPRGKQFQRYVDYLSWRYAQGNSMIEKNPPEPM